MRLTIFYGILKITAINGIIIYLIDGVIISHLTHTDLIPNDNKKS